MQLFILKAIITLLLCITAMELSAHNYTFKSYSETLPQTYIYNINQSNNGFLWIATEAGLIQYDGFEFRHKFSNVIDNKNFITSSLKDNESIWFGHFQGTISKLKKDSLHIIYESEKKSIITHIEKANNGEIWASTYSNGFIIIDSLQNSFTNLKFDEITFINNFKFIDESKLLVGTQDGLWFFKKQKNNQWRPEQKITEMPNNGISKIIKLKNSQKYVVATLSQGLFIIEFGGNRPFVEPIKLETQLKLEQIQDIIEDGQQNLWISTFGNGIFRITPNQQNEYKTVHKIEKNDIDNYTNVKTVFEDKEGNIWCGSYGTGLLRIIKQPFTSVRFNELENGGNITAVLCDGTSTLWAGTAEKIIKYQENKEPLIINLPNNLKNGFVTSLYFNNDTLWIGTEKNGVYVLNVKKLSINKYHISNGFLENSITAIKGKENILWISTKKGICHIDRNNNIHNWYTIEKGGLPHNLINYIFLDSRERLWLSTPNNTIAYIDSTGKTTKIPIYSNSKIFTVGTITEDSDSTIWIGTQGAGIFKFEYDSIANLTKEEGLYSNYCTAIAADNKNNIWVTHTGGISRIKTLNFAINPIHKLANIKSNYGFNKNSIQTAYDDRIIIGSTTGMWIYDPKDDLPDSISPTLSIKSIKIGNEIFSPDEKISIKHGKYDITINYIGVFLENPENVWYKYELENVDLQPNFTQNTSVSYKNINDGKYIFNLSASISGDFKDAKIHTIEIIVKKPFWKSPLFITVFISILIAISIHVLIKREQKHRLEKYNLTSEVIDSKKEIDKQNLLLDEKQQLIIKQNEELKNYKTYLEKIVEERTRELIVAKNKAEESDRLKTAFLNNISHEIRTPLHAICGFSKFLSDDTFAEIEKEQFISTINQNAEDLMQMVDEIIDMSVIDSQVSLLTEKSFDLHNLLTEIEDYYQQKNKSSIEIKYIKNNSEKAIMLLFDKTRVKHIYFHLINNSLKFSDEGEITFGYEIEDEHVICYVKDTGIGVDKNEIKNIFKPFHKVISSSDRLYRGTGIGLTIVKKLIELMEGEIWVESDLNKGTNVYFKIPLNPTLHI